VAMTVFVPLTGWTSDRIGARNLFAAAVALGLFQNIRAGTQLALGDFQNAIFVSAGLMAVAVAWLLQLPRNAGDDLSRRS